MRFWLALAILTCSAGAGASAQELQPTPSSPLEGTVWDVRVTPDAAAQQLGEQPFTETITFKDGKVIMAEVAKYGFSPSSYTLTPAGEAWSFTTEQLSVKEGRSVWNASFGEDGVKGTLTWKKKDGTAVNYQVQGSRRSG
jgi:hypothetical protein